MRFLADVVVPSPALDPRQPLGTIDILVGICALVPLVLVLTRLRREKGWGHVALGLLSFGMYPYIWGWLQMSRLGLKKVMPLWTALVLLFFALLLAGSRPSPHPYPRPWPVGPTPGPSPVKPD